jgi:glycosyltransferase involved in cell wall biosynthesis
MVRILFLIRALEIGGAERQLVELVKHMDHDRFDIHVVTFYDGGSLRPKLENIVNVRVSSLGKGGRWDLISFFGKFLHLLKTNRPQVIQSYLDVPNSFNVLGGKILGIKTCLGASASYVDFSRYDWTAALVYKTGAFLSHFSDKVISNSFAGQKYNVDHGYSAKKMIVIPNGNDTKTYHPDRSERKRMRSTWGIREDEKVVGIVGRIDPMKDHPTFLRAAALVASQIPNCRFVCIGRGPQPYRAEMMNLAVSLLDRSKVNWIDDCEDKDMPAAFNALDLLVSSSYGEGLPVVLSEGMATGVPCVVTNVGDSAFAVGDTGKVVPPKEPGFLAEAIIEMLKMPEDELAELGRKARQRVEELFSIEKMSSSYEQVFEGLAGN